MLVESVWKELNGRLTKSALALGILLLFIPEQSFPLLANLKCGFWIASGFALLYREMGEN